MSTPASIPARNGTSSISHTSSLERLTIGRSLCESILVSPWPGKCFRVVRTPPDFAPFTAAATWSPTFFGSPASKYSVYYFSLTKASTYIDFSTTVLDRAIQD